MDIDVLILSHSPFRSLFRFCLSSIWFSIRIFSQICLHRHIEEETGTQTFFVFFFFFLWFIRLIRRSLNKKSNKTMYVHVPITSYTLEFDWSKGLQWICKQHRKWAKLHIRAHRLDKMFNGILIKAVANLNNFMVEKVKKRLQIDIEKGCIDDDNDDHDDIHYTNIRLIDGQR